MIQDVDCIVYIILSLCTGGGFHHLFFLRLQEEDFIIYFVLCLQEEDFGGFIIQQNVGGNPVSLFRFPPRLRMERNATVTVWAGCNDAVLHQPPTDFVYKEQLRWGTGPECTTILCKPNGQVRALGNLLVSIQFNLNI